MKKVVATLKYGYLLNKPMKCLLWGSIIWGIALAVSLAVCYGIGVFEFDATKDEILACFGWAIIGIFAPIMYVIVLVRDNKRRKEIKIWQDDFVETEAKVINIPVEYAFKNNPYALRVKFEIDGIEYIKESKYSHRGLDNNVPMAKLAGDNVPIYYSAKYDQVVFIKKQKS